MREFLLGLYIEHGGRPFPYKDNNEEYSRLFMLARDNDYLDMLTLPKYDMKNLPYKLTAKALEYIKSHD